MRRYCHHEQSVQSRIATSHNALNLSWHCQQGPCRPPRFSLLSSRYSSIWYKPGLTGRTRRRKPRLQVQTSSHDMVLESLPCGRFGATHFGRFEHSLDHAVDLSGQPTRALSWLQPCFIQSCAGHKAGYSSPPSSPSKHENAAVSSS